MTRATKPILKLITKPEDVLPTPPKTRLRPLYVRSSHTGDGTWNGPDFPTELPENLEKSPYVVLASATTYLNHTGKLLKDTYPDAFAAGLKANEQFELNQNAESGFLKVKKKADILFASYYHLPELKLETLNPMQLTLLLGALTYMNDGHDFVRALGTAYLSIVKVPSFLDTKAFLDSDQKLIKHFSEEQVLSFESESPFFVEILSAFLQYEENVQQIKTDAEHDLKIHALQKAIDHSGFVAECYRRRENLIKVRPDNYWLEIGAKIPEATIKNFYTAYGKSLTPAQSECLLQFYKDNEIGQEEKYRDYSSYALFESKISTFFGEGEAALDFVAASELGLVLGVTIACDNGTTQKAILIRETATEIKIENGKEWPQNIWSGYTVLRPNEPALHYDIIDLQPNMAASLLPKEKRTPEEIEKLQNKILSSLPLAAERLFEQQRQMPRSYDSRKVLQLIEALSLDAEDFLKTPVNELTIQFLQASSRLDSLKDFRLALDQSEDTPIERASFRYDEGVFSLKSANVNSEDALLCGTIEENGKIEDIVAVRFDEANAYLVLRPNQRPQLVFPDLVASDSLIASFEELIENL
jgi:hypothetical protein